MQDYLDPHAARSRSADTGSPTVLIWMYRSTLPAWCEKLTGLSPGDVAGLFRFLAYARTLYKRAGPIFLLRERPALRDLLSGRGIDAARIDAHLSLHTAVRRFFKDKRLVQLFDRYATYNGSSPYRAPATLAMIPYIELGGGGWYIQGGLYRLAESLLSVATELGVDFRPNCEVTRILFRVESKRGKSRRSAARERGRTTGR